MSDQPTILFQQLAHAEGLPLPQYATPGAAGLDIASAVGMAIPPGEWAIIPTGVQIELPHGCEAQVRPRSGLAARNGVTVLNSPGTIDSDYRGEIMVILINHGKGWFQVSKGDRIAQLVIAPVSRVQVQVSEHLSTTERGSGGFGSTGF